MLTSKNPDHPETRATAGQLTRTQQTPLYITCGMYAFTDELRSAWQQLFEHFFDLTKPQFAVDPKLSFETDANALNHAALWFGHTCGYPLMTHLRDHVTPINVPIFDVEGRDQTRYASRLTVRADSGIETLEDCRGLRAVINNIDSNSGMNLLRHAVADLNQRGRFFSDTHVSGSHLQSLIDIAEGRADIAAIDSVSFRFVQDAWPELAASVRSIGFTAQTCGLPFVMPTREANTEKKQAITRHLNEALSLLDEHHKNRLHLIGFEDVTLNDYQSVMDLEDSAQKARYPVIW